MAGWYDDIRRHLDEAEEHMREAAKWRAIAHEHARRARETLAAMNRDAEPLPDPWEGVRGLRSERAIWVTRDLIRHLIDKEGLPQATPEIARDLALNHEYGLMLRMLNRLARLGIAEKWQEPEFRAASWQLARPRGPHP